MVEKLKEELKRLRLPTNDSYIKELLLDNLTEDEYLSIIRQIDKKEAALVGLVNHPQFLKTQEVYNLTLKLTGLMEASDNKEEFQNLLKKKKKPKEKPTDFDKILKGILSVPKPDKKEKPSK